MTDIYWHIYGRDQIKPALRGNLVYVMEIPRDTIGPVLRHVFDPSGLEFPAGKTQLMRLLKRLPHGIIYQGVNKAAVYDVLLSDPRIRRHDIHLHEYNRALVRNSRHFFLVDPEHPFEEMPAATAHMLCEGEVRADNGRLLV